MKVADADLIVLDKYPEAESIYSLSRKKAHWNAGEKIAEAAIFLFTPFINGLEQANALSDLGIYYLVEQNGKQLLVRIAKYKEDEMVQEKEITGEFNGEEYIVGKDKFEKVRNIQKK